MKLSVFSVSLISCVFVWCQIAGSAKSDDPPQKTEKKEVSRSKPTFTISKETTYVLGPVNAEGYIDYLQALNDLSSKGMTVENNACIPLIRALGPKPSGYIPPKEYFKRLGIPGLPQEGNYFVQKEPRFYKPDLMAPEKIFAFEKRITTRSWSEKEFPRMAEWVKVNAKAIELTIEASRRSRFFSPYYFDSFIPFNSPSFRFRVEHPGLMTQDPAIVWICKDVGTLLLAQAMMHTHEGRFEEASKNLIAAHRLARLLAQGPTDSDRYAGFTLEDLANEADITWLSDGRLDSATLARFQGLIDTLPPFPPAAELIDKGERLKCLDHLFLAARDGLKVLPKLLNPSEEEDGSLNRISDLRFRNLPLDPALKETNAWYDRIVGVMKIADRAERMKKLKTLEDELKTLNKGFMDVFETKVRDKNTQPEDRGRLLGEWTRLLILPGQLTIQQSDDLSEQRHHNVRIAIALALYHRDHKSYPATLVELTPMYLKSIPPDLFSLKEPIYRTTQDGYLLYSVGRNGRDDGGSDDARMCDDIAVRIPLPKSSSESFLPSQQMSAQPEDPLPAGAIARLGSGRFRHYSHVTGFCYSPNGKWIATGGEDGTVRICDSDTGRLVKILRGHGSSLMALAFSPDGTKLASAGGSFIKTRKQGSDCSIRIWDCASWKQERQLVGHDKFVWSLVYSSDGKLLFSLDGDGVMLKWDMNTGKFDLPVAGVASIALSPDDQVLAIGGPDKIIRLGDLTKTKSQSLKGHSEGIKKIVFTADGKKLVSSGLDKTIRVWELATGKVLHTISASKGVYHPLAVSPNGKFLAGEGESNHFCVWDMETGESKIDVDPRDNWISAVAFAPDGKTVTGITAWGTFLRFRVPSFEEITRTEPHNGTIQDLTFSANEKVLATCGQDRRVHLWDFKTYKHLEKIASGSREIRSLAFNQDGTLLVGCSMFTVEQWDVNVTVDKPTQLFGVGSGRLMALLNQDKELVCYISAIRRLSLTDLDFKVEYPLPRVMFSPTQIVVSPDGKKVAVGGGDPRILVWDVANGKQLASFNTTADNDAKGLAFTPDGRFLISAGKEKLIRFWNMAEMKQESDMQIATDQVECLSLSPDGRWLAAGCGDWQLRLYDLTLRKEVKVLPGHTGSIKCLRFSPSGNYLATGSTDSTVLIWDIAQIVGKDK